MKTEHVLIKPVVTEKTVGQSGKYTFVVHNDATKSDIVAAMKEFYGVDAQKVNVNTTHPKHRMTNRRGSVIIKRPEQKKAVITLKKGESISFNDFK